MPARLLHLVDSAVEQSERGSTDGVHPMAVIESGVHLGRGVRVGAFAVVKTGTVLGDGVRIHEHAVVGGDPQDLGFDLSTSSGVRIGAGTVVREGVTIHRSSKAGGVTTIGASVFLMCNAHVGHDCTVGDGSILANGVLLGGYVEIGSDCFLGGNAVFHQFVRVGKGAIVSGGSRIAHDVPPFVMAEAYSRVAGLNLVGLKRRGVAAVEIADLKRCYRAVFLRSGSLATLASEHQPETDCGREFLRFFASSRRGFVRSQLKGKVSGSEGRSSGGLQAG